MYYPREKQSSALKKGQVSQVGALYGLLNISVTDQLTDQQTNQPTN